MNKANYPKLLASCVLVLGLIALMSNIFDFPLVGVQMRLVSAVSLVISGVILLCLVYGQMWANETLLPLLTVILLILVGVNTLSGLFGVGLGSPAGSATLSNPAVTSYPAIIGYSLVVLVGILSSIGVGTHWRVIVGCVIGGLGLVASVGHLLGIPFLYYGIAGFSSPLEAISSVAFLLIGSVLIFADGTRGKNVPFVMSFRSRFTIATVSIVVIMMLVSTFVVYNQRKDMLYAQVEEEGGMMIRNVETVLESYIDDASMVLRSTQKNPVIIQSLKGAQVPPDLLVHLNTIKDSAGIFDTLALLNGSCVVLARSDGQGLWDEKHFSYQDYCVSIRERRGVYVSEAFNDTTTGDQVISVSVPLMENSSFVGYMMGTLSLPRLRHLLYGMAGEESIIHILSRDGALIIDTADEYSNGVSDNPDQDVPVVNAMVARGVDHGTLYLPGEQGSEIISYKQLVDFIVIFERDQESALEGIHDLLYTQVWIVLVSLIIVAIAVWGVAGAITPPLRRLSQDINQITKGNLDVTFEDSSTSEVQDLIMSLNRVLASLKLAILRTGVSKEDIGIGEAIAAKKTAQQQFAELYREQQTILDSLPALVFYKDLNNNLVRVNNALAMAVGKASGELEGRNLRELWPDLAGRYFEADKEVIRSGKPVRGVIEPLETVQGRRWFKTDKIPQRDAQGNIIGVIGFSIDITKEKNAQERFAALYESSSDAVMTLEPPSWNFTAGNPATIHMFGARSEEHFTGFPPWRLSPKYQPDGVASGKKVRKMIILAMNNGNHSFEWMYKRINGEEFPAHVLLTRVDIGGKSFLQATVRDITEQKRLIEVMTNKDKILERTFDSFREPFFVVGLDNRLIRWNRSFEKLSKTKKIGKVDACFGREDRGRILSAIKTATKKGVSRAVISIKGKPLEIHMTSLKDDNHKRIGVSCIMLGHD